MDDGSTGGKIVLKSQPKRSRIGKVMALWNFGAPGAISPCSRFALSMWNWWYWAALKNLLRCLNEQIFDWYWLTRPFFVFLWFFQFFMSTGAKTRGVQICPFSDFCDFGHFWGLKSGGWYSLKSYKYFY